MLYTSMNLLYIPIYLEVFAIHLYSIDYSTIGTLCFHGEVTINVDNKKKIVMVITYYTQYYNTNYNSIIARII